MTTFRHASVFAFAGLFVGVLQLSAEDEKPEPPADRAERILKEADTVAKSLGERNAGDETRKRQEQILKELDELLKPPPMPPMNQSSSGGGGSSKSPPPPMGGGGQKQPQPMGGAGQKQNQPMGGGDSGSGSQSRREKRMQQGKGQQAKADPMNGGTRPMPMGKSNDGPMAKAEPMGTQPGSPMQPMTKGTPMQPMGLGNDEPPPPGKAGRLADIGRGVWGHLPEAVRQELDLYYRDQFMPRHADLLREYYSTIAEGGRR